MSPDITFKDYYLQFIHNAEEDKQIYNNKKNNYLNNVLEICYDRNVDF